MGFEEQAERTSRGVRKTVMREEENDMPLASILPI
jgi:hypothetical protein